MRLLPACLLALVLTGAIEAQDGLIASATRTVSVPPTEASIQVTVTTASTKTLDDVIGKVKEVGLTVENLASIVSTAGFVSPVPGVPGVAGTSNYTFRLTVPLGETTATLRKMDQFSAANAEYRTQASLVGVTATVAAIQEAQRRAFPDLYKEAKARAQEMASGAGLSAGRVLAVTDGYALTAISVAFIYTSVQVPFSVSVRLAID
jgi:hypothetical protein